MNGNRQTLLKLTQDIIKIVDTSSEIVLFPAFVYLDQIKAEINRSKFQLGAQNVSQFPDGAYTGEVSAAMLNDAGFQYGLIGHSDRRHIFWVKAMKVIAEKIS